ncbi:MAG TPA: hypothetical protein VLT85_12010, partial [Terriglobales bacterium]|nr:hypothetical protein [Terriglobales bacterium]
MNEVAVPMRGRRGWLVLAWVSAFLTAAASVAPLFIDWVPFKWAVVLLLVLFPLDILVARKAGGLRRDQTERRGASLALIYILL